MCHIQIGGRHLVNAWDLKFDQGNESPDIFYMRLKSAFSENLLAKDGKFHGQAQATSEVFSPMAESMIVIKWLEAINPALPRHIQDTRATLFTSEKPNFADIQQDLCEIMDTLLQEIEQVDSVSALSVQDDYDLTVEAMVPILVMASLVCAATEAIPKIREVMTYSLGGSDTFIDGLKRILCRCQCFSSSLRDG